MTDDSTLLRRYVFDRSEEAFAELVGRHLPLVYSAAVRRLDGDMHRAADVSQAVFAQLAKDAERLSSHPTLTGWLYRAVRSAVIDVVRTEKRRVAREIKAHAMQEISTPSKPEVDWQQLRPVIDQTLDELRDAEREAVLLRFFQQRAFRQIGTTLGLSEEAARKRVERALEKLKHQLARRGITSTLAALTTILSTETTIAAPASLATSIVSSGLASGAAATAGIIFMTATKLQVAIATVALLGGATVLVFQQRTLAHERERRQRSEEQSASLAAKNGLLASAQSSAEAESARLRTELTALRSKAGAIVHPANDPIAASTASHQPQSAPLTKPRLSVGRAPQEIARLHRRYDPFLQERGLSSAEMDQFIELLLQLADIRRDLQDSMREVGASGGTKEIEAIRSELYSPVVQQMQDLLGRDGYTAYRNYEQTSFYRAAYIERMTPLFLAANASLSTAQAEQLARILAANNRPTRRNPTDLGSETRIDWNAVTEQSSTVLNLEQRRVLQVFAAQDAQK